MLRPHLAEYRSQKGASLLESLSAGDIISIQTEREANGGNLTTATDAILLLWQK